MKRIIAAAGLASMLACGSPAPNYTTHSVPIKMSSKEMNKIRATIMNKGNPETPCGGKTYELEYSCKPSDVCLAVIDEKSDGIGIVSKQERDGKLEIKIRNIDEYNGKPVITHSYKIKADGVRSALGMMYQMFKLTSTCDQNKLLNGLEAYAYTPTETDAAQVVKELKYIK